MLLIKDSLTRLKILQLHANFNFVLLLFVYFLVFFSFFVCLPFFAIGFEGVDAIILLFNSRDYLFDNLKQWHDNKIDKSRLWFGNVDCIPITQHTYWEILFSFEVSLIEEFIKQKIGPLLNHFKWTALLGDVSGMD